MNGKAIISSDIYIYIFIYIYLLVFFLIMFNAFLQQNDNLWSVKVELATNVVKRNASSKSESRRAAAAILIELFWPTYFNKELEIYCLVSKQWQRYQIIGFHSVG